MNISIKDIEVAYRKLKSHIYYDNTFLNVRIKLAEFESKGIKKQLDLFYQTLRGYYNHDSHSFEQIFNQIEYSLYPKQFHSDEESNQEYSNQTIHDKYIIKRLSVFIYCPVEVYLISILWIMKVGYHLDTRINSTCYANRIDHFDDYDKWEKSSKLFNIYFYKYSEWRDKAIKKATILHETNNSVLLTLDIKNYFNSIDFKIDGISPYPAFEWINKLLSELHQKYADVLSNNKLINSNKHILPIGLMSSYILANYYLKEFDNFIADNLKPAYYGRYVDDIIILFEHHNSKRAHRKEYLDEYLFNPQTWNINEVSVSTEIIDDNGEPKTEFSIKVKNNKLIIQEEKVKFFYFTKNNSINILKEFEKEILKNSSEFRFEPVADSVLGNFESSSYRITYSDTINKLRSVEGFSTNKLGASKHLSKIIEITKYAKKLNLETIQSIYDQITDYFSGIRSIELYSLWEKILTYFIMCKSESHLVEFAKNQIENINKIELHSSLSKENPFADLYLKNIKLKLLNHLTYCFSMAASLHLGFFNRKVINKIKKSISDNKDIILTNFDLPTVNKYSKYLISSNMLRHQYCFYPLLNYCNQSKSFSFINEKIPRSTKYEINKNKLKFSPRFIPLHEFTQFYYLRLWFSSSRYNAKFINDPIDYCIKEYNKFTSSFYNKIYQIDIRIPPRKRNFRKIIIKSNILKPKLKVGLVNIDINVYNSLLSMKGNPNLMFSRLNDINEILNFGLKKNCDIIIFPEISIPLQWMDNILRFSRNNQISVVCGLEHFQNSKKEVFNYIATILPFEKEIRGKYIYKNTLLDLRLKKNYSPEEIEILKSHKLKTPSYQSKEPLRLYKWRSTYFSTLNCYELTDLNNRMIFKGIVDFLCVSEFNRDISYFSSIIESVARDIHAYIIQVNSSSYGDSRITLPADSYNRDQAKIKGGKDVTIITGIVDIKALREFQSNPKKFESKSIKKDKETIFKPLPANFIMSKVRKIK